MALINPGGKNQDNLQAVCLPRERAIGAGRLDERAYLGSVFGGAYKLCSVPWSRALEFPQIQRATFGAGSRHYRDRVQFAGHHSQFLVG